MAKVMSKCPYTNFKDKVMKYINFIRTPRKEYGDLPPCPFVGAEIDKGKLMIDKFNPKENTLLEMVKAYDESDYDSALFVQISEEPLSKFDTVGYQDYINKTMKDNNYGHLKCICFNPNDELDIDGFNPRSHAPYFLINIATREALDKAHNVLSKTKYYNNMNMKYLRYLHKSPYSILKKKKI